MKHGLYKRQAVMFVVMVIVGVLFNPMNILAYKTTDLYLSLTLFYSGLLMASNMIWAHEIIHYLSMGHFNIKIFSIGVLISILTTILLLRNQLFVDDEQWLRRMISHHSTALTTTNKLLKTNDNFKQNPKIYRLAKDIIYNQEREILFMKSFLYSS